MFEVFIPCLNNKDNISLQKTTGVRMKVYIPLIFLEIELFYLKKILNQCLIENVCKTIEQIHKNMINDNIYIRTLLIFLSTIILTAFKTDKPAYTIYNKKGKKVKYQKVINEIKGANVVFFGEIHTNPISHWLQYEIVNDMLKETNGSLIIGGEMFEADNQLIIDEYLKGIILEKRFENEARLWENYETDYEPLVKLAKEYNIPLIATNIPRRYASVVYRHGFEGLDSLSNESKQYIAPLPIHYDQDLPSYNQMMTMDHFHRTDAAVQFFPQAQAIKDATMAWFIYQNYQPGNLFFHINGAYHSDNFEGIIWHLRKYQPEITVKTITTVEQDDIDSLFDEHAKADFIIAVPKSMTRTH